ncbi:hypothetical protein CBR_g60024 [Chara braunii]|uniref:Uncharacterized protein n=1 Tax=Chara braunii TaxID=69332 RepID=A0A388K8V2_CHABU|nr:hypothetical protein CBR_g60024 [Chara braunii]|eukprot:GBG66373.1 hypothetical protein CBR_g60024 [Chara braunii]
MSSSRGEGEPTATSGMGSGKDSTKRSSMTSRTWSDHARSKWFVDWCCADATNPVQQPCGPVIFVEANKRRRVLGAVLQWENAKGSRRRFYMKNVYGSKGNVVAGAKGAVLDMCLFEGFGAGAANTPFYNNLRGQGGFVLGCEFFDLLEDKGIAFDVPCEVGPDLELSIPLQSCGGCESSGAAREGGDLGSGEATHVQREDARGQFDDSEDEVTPRPLFSPSRERDRYLFLKSRFAVFKKFEGQGLDDELWDNSRKHVSDSALFKDCPPYMGCDQENSIEVTEKLVGHKKLSVDWRNKVLSVLNGSRLKRREVALAKGVIHIKWKDTGDVTSIAPFTNDPLEADIRGAELKEAVAATKSHTLVLDLCEPVDLKLWKPQAWETLNSYLQTWCPSHWTLVVFVPRQHNLSFLASMHHLSFVKLLEGKWVRRVQQKKSFPVGNNLYTEEDRMYILFKGDDLRVNTSVVYEGNLPTGAAAVVRLPQRVTQTDVSEIPFTPCDWSLVAPERQGSVYGDMERNSTQFVGLLDFLGKKGEGVVFLGKPHVRSVWKLLKAGRHLVAMEGIFDLLQFTMQVVKSEVNSSGHNWGGKGIPPIGEKGSHGRNTTLGGSAGVAGFAVDRTPSTGTRPEHTTHSADPQTSSVGSARDTLAALVALGSRSVGKPKSAGIRTTSGEEPPERSGMRSCSGSGDPSTDREIRSIAARDGDVETVSPGRERRPQGLQREAASAGSGDTETTKSADIRTSSGGVCRPGIVVPLRGAAFTGTEGRSLRFGTGTAEGDKFRGREVREEMEEQKGAQEGEEEGEEEVEGEEVGETKLIDLFEGREGARSGEDEVEHNEDDAGSGESSDEFGQLYGEHHEDDVDDDAMAIEMETQVVSSLSAEPEDYAVRPLTSAVDLQHRFDEASVAISPSEKSRRISIDEVIDGILGDHNVSATANVTSLVAAALASSPPKSLVLQATLAAEGEGDCGGGQHDRMEEIERYEPKGKRQGKLGSRVDPAEEEKERLRRWIAQRTIGSIESEDEELEALCKQAAKLELAKKRKRGPEVSIGNIPPMTTPEKRTSMRISEEAKARIESIRGDLTKDVAASSTPSKIDLSLKHIMASCGPGGKEKFEQECHEFYDALTIEELKEACRREKEAYGNRELAIKRLITRRSAVAYDPSNIPLPATPRITGKSSKGVVIKEEVKVGTSESDQSFSEDDSE